MRWGGLSRRYHESDAGHHIDAAHVPAINHFAGEEDLSDLAVLLFAKQIDAEAQDVGERAIGIGEAAAEG